LATDRNKRDWNIALAAAVVIVGAGTILTGSFIEDRNTQIFRDKIEEQVVIKYELITRIVEKDNDVYEVTVQAKGLDVRSWDRVRVLKTAKARIRHIFEENYSDKEIVEIKRTTFSDHLRKVHFLVTTKKAG
jgi:hypothetical protein